MSGDGNTYIVDFPSMTSDVAQSLASLRQLRLSIIMEGPKPNYDVHGHRFNFQDLMDYIDRSVNILTKELVALQGNDTIISRIR